MDSSLLWILKQKTRCLIWFCSYNRSTNVLSSVWSIEAYASPIIPSNGYKFKWAVSRIPKPIRCLITVKPFTFFCNEMKRKWQSKQNKIQFNQLQKLYRFQRFHSHHQQHNAKINHPMFVDTLTMQYHRRNVRHLFDILGNRLDFEKKTMIKNNDIFERKNVCLQLWVRDIQYETKDVEKSITTLSLCLRVLWLVWAHNKLFSHSGIFWRIRLCISCSTVYCRFYQWALNRNTEKWFKRVN